MSSSPEVDFPFKPLVRVTTSFSVAKMAAMRNHVDLPPLHYQCYKVDKFKNCANCMHLEYQLRATNEELNSAKAIIALLREDLTNMNTMRTADQQLTQDPRGTRHNITCEYDPKGENWTTIT